MATRKINFVKELTKDGVTYEWFVAFDDYRVSSALCYCNVDVRGRTCIKAFPKEKLPKYIQKFIDSHKPRLIDNHIAGDDDGFAQYCYDKRN
jgi:hypothetical protein